MSRSGHWGRNGMTFRTTVAACTLAAIGASCARSTVTLEEFIAEANPICSAANARISEIVLSVFADMPGLAAQEDPSDEALVALYSELVDRGPELRGAPSDMLATLRELEMPEGSAAITELLDDIEQRFAEEWEILVGASQSADAARVQWDRDGSPFADLNVRAEGLGLGACTFS